MSTARRLKCHVPPEVIFEKKWQIAVDLLDRSLPGLPHGWITGDDEIGRVSKLRTILNRRSERYILDVPCNTTLRDLERRRPRRRQAGRGRKREVPWQRADAWAKSQPDSRWTRLTVRGGEKGPLEVDAMTVRVRAKQDRKIGSEERLVVIRPVGETKIDYAITNAGPEIPLIELVRVQRERHRIEELFQAGNGEAGLDHYEVRSWVGWHHHMTLALVALWFLCLERRRAGGENPSDHSLADAPSVHDAAPSTGTDCSRNRRLGHTSSVA